ncbi:hypothetical protein VNO80_10280 [Phaseolus coccineus]|uniref:Uncharacterized protein n=1 Tax=Phaseolus coccineus TaxID=3886 RepID=A0AAN9RDB0_PHACN
MSKAVESTTQIHMLESRIHEGDLSSTKKKLEELEVGHLKEKLESTGMDLEVLCMELTVVNAAKKEAQEGFRHLQVELGELKVREEGLKIANANFVESSMLEYTEGFKKAMH